MKTKTQKIMLVDDDPTIVETLEYNLKRSGFETSAFHNGHSALAKLDETCPDLIILDWSLPDLIGPEICKIIRTRLIEVPILMLTARATPNDIAQGLQSGADDYIAKPFSSVELMARINALLRRSKGATRSDRLAVGELSLDEDSRKVELNGKNIELSPKEFHLLKLFMQNPSKTLSTELLLNQVWGYEFTGGTKTVAVHIRWLRQKLEKDPKNPTLLETIHRAGYRLNPPLVKPAIQNQAQGDKE